jgi:phosphomethylpyrimidine synthase
MKMTEDVRKFAAEQGIKEETAIEEGLKQKATEFTKHGAEIYAKRWSSGQDKGLIWCACSN